VLVAAGDRERMIPFLEPDYIARSISTPAWSRSIGMPISSHVIAGDAGIALVAKVRMTTRMRIDVISLFPEFSPSAPASVSSGVHENAGCWPCMAGIPRDYATGNYRRVDDRPFGGGPGMVMLIDPLREAIAAARAADPAPVKVIYLSPQGARLDQARCASSPPGACDPVVRPL
jgi:hypothetical protein